MKRLFPIVLLLLPATTFAQGLTSGSSRFDPATPVTTCSSTLSGQFFSATGTDTLYQHFWAICVDNAPAACRLNSPTFTDDGTVYPELMRRTFDNFTGVPLNVTQLGTITEVAPGAAIFVMRVRIENFDSTAHTVNIYAYSDFDLINLGSNQALGSTTAAGNFLHDITGTNPEHVYLLAYGADGDRVDTFSTVRTEILGGCPDYASAPFSPGSFGPADYTGAFQWKDRPILPGTSFEAVLAMGHNQMPSEGPPAGLVAYGSASGSGTALLLGASPIVGNAIEWRVLAGTRVAGQPGAVLFGNQQISFPICGLTLLTSADVYSDPFTLDSNGLALRYYPLPYPAAALGAGFTLFAQAIHIDPTSGACIPISTTNGLIYGVGY